MRRGCCTRLLHVGCMRRFVNDVVLGARVFRQQLVSDFEAGSNKVEPSAVVSLFLLRFLQNVSTAHIAAMTH